MAEDVLTAMDDKLSWLLRYVETPDGNPVAFLPKAGGESSIFAPRATVDFGLGAVNPVSIKKAFGAIVTRNYFKHLAKKPSNISSDYFPTDQGTAKKMLNWITQGGKRKLGRTLEPHGGGGHLVNEIKKHTGKFPDIIELDPKRAKQLQAQGLPVRQGNFLDNTEQYDSIIMNPPFSKGQDKIHVLKALESLKPGGKVVSLVDSRAIMKGTRLNKWVESNPAVEFLGYKRVHNPLDPNHSKMVGVIGVTK